MATNRTGGDAAVPMTFLDRWKRRAAARRERLRTTLARPRGAAAQGAVRQDWIERTLANAIARRRWLEVRLEHLRAVENMLRESAGRSPDESPEPQQANGGAARPPTTPASTGGRAGTGKTGST